MSRRTTMDALAIDGHTNPHAGYAISLRIRKKIEEGLGRIKIVGGLEKTKLRIREAVGWAFILTPTAYNLVRLPKQLVEAA